MNDDFEYSPEALDSRKWLLDVDAVVYVEGIDDELFWPKIFNKFSSRDFSFEQVGGKPELIKKMKILKDNNSEFIIATDSDYSLFIEEFDHENIIKKFGHSIENTLIQKESIIEIVENSSNKKNKDIISQYQLFQNNIDQLVYELLHIDIFCYENDHKSVIGKSAEKFTKSKNSYFFCDKKIAILKIGINMPNEEACKEKLNIDMCKLNLNSLDVINGHFLKSSFLKFVIFNSEGFREKYNLSSDSLLTNLLISFRNIFTDTHPHYAYYETEVLRIESISKSFN